MNLTPNLFEAVCDSIPTGGTLLELGSGATSKLFTAKGIEVYSIEHNERWLNKFNTNYIYAPLKDFDSEDAIEYFKSSAWYDPARFIALPVKYDALLIDGPPRRWRPNFWFFRQFFNSNVPWFFDDVHRPEFYRILIWLARERGISNLNIQDTDKGRAWVRLDPQS